MAKKRMWGHNHLVSRIKIWEAKRDKPQAELSHDILIDVLNAIHKAISRAQLVTRVGIFVERETQPAEYSRWLAKAEKAVHEAQEVVQSYGFYMCPDLTFAKDDKGRLLAVYSVFVSRSRKADGAGLKRRHWQERKKRSDREGGPRPRKTKEVKKKKVL